MRRRLLAIIVAVLGIAASGLFYKYGVAENKVMIQDLQEKHAAYIDSVNKARTVAERLDEMKRRLRIAELQWEKATEMLPREKEIPDLLTSITRVGARNNISFRLFQPNPMKPEDIYVSVPVKVGVSGTYHNLGSFLSAIGNLPRIVRVSGLRLVGSRAEGTSVSADFMLTTYVLSEAKTRVATRRKPTTTRPRQSRRSQPSPTELGDD